MFNIAHVKFTENENFVLKNNNYLLKKLYLKLNAQVLMQFFF